MTVMKKIVAVIAATLALVWLAPSSALAQQQGQAKVVGTCGTATYVSGKMAYPTQDTTGVLCTSATGGGGGGGPSFTAATGPFSVTAGANKPAGISTANSAQWFVPVKPGTTSEIDLSSQCVWGTDGATCASPSNPLPTQDAATGSPAATAPTKALLEGCRAATASPTAVTDGQLVAKLCGTEGKQITLPYAIKELMVRGSTGATATATQVSLIAAGGVNIKNYITGIQCANSGSSTSILTFTDANTTILINPAGGGTNVTFPVPLVTAANTAFQVTFGTASTNQYCSAQGYTGP